MSSDRASAVHPSRRRRSPCRCEARGRRLSSARPSWTGCSDWAGLNPRWRTGFQRAGPHGEPRTLQAVDLHGVKVPAPVVVPLRRLERQRDGRSAGAVGDRLPFARFQRRALDPPSPTRPAARAAPVGFACRRRWPRRSRSRWRPRSTGRRAATSHAGSHYRQPHIGHRQLRRLLPAILALVERIREFKPGAVFVQIALACRWPATRRRGTTGHPGGTAATGAVP